MCYVLLDGNLFCGDLCLFGLNATVTVAFLSSCLLSVDVFWDGLKCLLSSLTLVSKATRSSVWFDRIKARQIYYIICGFVDFLLSFVCFGPCFLLVVSEIRGLGGVVDGHCLFFFAVDPVS